MVELPRHLIHPDVIHQHRVLGLTRSLLSWEQALHDNSSDSFDH